MSIRTVFVKFRPATKGGYYASRDKEYCYLYDGPFTLEEGDVVVVKSPSDGFVCVDVIREVDGADDRAIKWLAGVVDVDAYEERMSKEKERRVLLSKLASRWRNSPAKPYGRVSSWLDT